MNNENGTVTDPNAPLTEQDKTGGDAHDATAETTARQAYEGLLTDFQAMTQRNVRDLHQYGVAMRVQAQLMPLLPDMTHETSRGSDDNISVVFGSKYASFSLRFDDNDVYLDGSSSDAQVKDRPFQITAAGIPTDVYLAIAAFAVLLPMLPLPKQVQTELIEERNSAEEEAMHLLSALFGGGSADHDHGHGLSFVHLGGHRRGQSW